MKISIYRAGSLIPLLGILLSAAAAETSAGNYVRQGDSAYVQFDNQKALMLYQKALAEDSLNYEAAWKLSRAYVDVGEVLNDKDERKAHYTKAAAYARKAIAIDSTDDAGHLFYGIALGRVALDAGAKERIRLSKRIKEQVDKALELNPQNDIAWHVLGRWHRKISTLSWIEKRFAGIFLGGVPKEASLEKAVECFQRAIELHPESVNHHLQLGLTYEEVDEKEKAIAEYQTLLELPDSDSDDPLYKDQARERLQDSAVIG